MEEEFGLKKHRTLISQQVRTSVIKYIIYVYIIYYLLYIYCIYIYATQKRQVKGGNRYLQAEESLKGGAMEIFLEGILTVH